MLIETFLYIYNRNLLKIKLMTNTPPLPQLKIDICLSKFCLDNQQYYNTVLIFLRYSVLSNVRYITGTL